MCMANGNLTCQARLVAFLLVFDSPADRSRLQDLGFISSDWILEFPAGWAGLDLFRVGSEVKIGMLFVVSNPLDRLFCLVFCFVPGVSGAVRTVQA